MALTIAKALGQARIPRTTLSQTQNVAADGRSSMKWGEQWLKMVAMVAEVAIMVLHASTKVSSGGLLGLGRVNEGERRWLS